MTNSLLLRLYFKSFHDDSPAQMKEERQGNQRAGFLLKETLEIWGKGNFEITLVWIVFLTSFSHMCYIRIYVSTDPISHPYEFSSFVGYPKTDMTIKKEKR